MPGIGTSFLFVLELELELKLSIVFALPNSMELIPSQEAGFKPPLPEKYALQSKP